jgi:RNA polymerase sigma-70 factor (ECF subfamily)
LIIYFSLIDDVQQQSKFECLYQEYRTFMLYTANRILENWDDAEDVVHQAFLKVIEILSEIEDPLSPRTKSLMAIITERKAIDLYRAKKRKHCISLDQADLEIPCESDLEKLPDRMNLAEAIAALPPRYREVVLLRYDNGLSNIEIGHLLSMTPNHVAKTLQRAKERLAQYLSQNMEYQQG